MGEQSLIPIEILLVEDTLGGIDSVQYILKESRIFNKIRVVKNLKETLSFLYQENLSIQTDNQLLVIINLPLFIEEDIKAIKEIIHKWDKLTNIVFLTNNRMEEFLLKQQKINCLFEKKPFKFESFIKKLFSKYEYGLIINKENKPAQIK